MNEVIQNMLTRKSIRTYKKDQVKDEDLKDMHRPEEIRNLGFLLCCKITID